MYDCVVVGAGPAGMTAAHYLQRFRRNVAVIDAGDSRATRIPRSYNVPGYPGGIRGTRLLKRMRRQLEAARVSVVSETVTAIHDRGDALVLESKAGPIYARTVLLATGVRDIEPAIPGVDAVRRRGLLRQCPVCDAFEYSGRRIAVIGAGPHGARRGHVPAALQPGRDVVGAGLGPRPVTTTLSELAAQGITNVATPVEAMEVTAPSVALTLADATRVECDVVYAALGSAPNMQLGERLGAAIDDAGNLVVDAHCRTSVARVYAAGDVVVGLDQVAVAMGHGAIVATTVHNDLRTFNGKGAQRPLSNAESSISERTARSG
jgi:thioredoxin reductase (NADPH)